MLLAGILLGLAVAAVSFWFMPPATPANSSTQAVRLATDTSAAPTNLSGSDAPGASDMQTPFDISEAADTSAGLSSPDATTPAPVALEDVVARSLPAVASIQAGQSRGTGFFVRPNLVLTNAHVVEGQSSVQLQANGVRHTARVTTVSAGIDLALLEVYSPNERQATLRLGSKRNWHRRRRRRAGKGSTPA